MTTIIKKDVVIPDNGHLNIEVDVPAGLPSGNATMTVMLEPKSEKQIQPNLAAEMCGKGKGRVWIADDFDAPLDDFAEYM